MIVTPNDHDGDCQHLRNGWPAPAPSSAPCASRWTTCATARSMASCACRRCLKRRTEPSWRRKLTSARMPPITIEAELPGGEGEGRRGYALLTIKVEKKHNKEEHSIEADKVEAKFDKGGSRSPLQRSPRLQKLSGRLRSKSHPSDYQRVLARHYRPAILPWSSVVTVPQSISILLDLLAQPRGQIVDRSAPTSRSTARSIKSPLPVGAMSGTCDPCECREPDPRHFRHQNEVQGDQ